MGAEYFILSGSAKRGPFRFDQLSDQSLDGNTLVWQPGMSDWVRAEMLPALRPLLDALPPPVPKSATAGQEKSIAPEEIASSTKTALAAAPSSNDEGAATSKTLTQSADWARVRGLAKSLFWLHNVVALYVLAWLLGLFANPIWLFLANVPVAIIIVIAARFMNWQPIVMGVLGYLPIVNIVVIIVVSRAATAMLKRVGATIGFLGPKVPVNPPAEFHGFPSVESNRGSK